MKRILDVIAMGEANQNSQFGEYGGMHSSIKDAPDVSSMTIGEVKALQRQKVSEGAKSSAAGRYQIINKSMDKYQKAAGLDDEQPFSPDNQDLMVSSYISKHAGNDPEKIANIAASEFASIKNKNGVGNYDGKLNKAKIDRSEIINATKLDDEGYVIDHALLAKLNATLKPDEGYVTDPVLLAKLNATLKPSPTAPLSATRNGKTYTVNNNTFQDDLKAELAANPMDAKQAAMGTAITDLYQGGKQLLGMGDKQALANNKTIREAHPGYAIGGNVLTMIGGGIAAPVLNTLKGITAASAVTSGLAPTDNGTLLEHGKNAAIGGATGLAGTKLVQGIGSALTQRAAKAAAKPNAQNISLLAKEGISLTPGQYAGGFLKNFEDKATSWPIVGNIINNARGRGIEDFNKAVISKATLPSMQVSGIGNNAVQDLRQGLGSAYDNVLAKSSANVNDPQYINNMTNLKALVSSLPKKEQSAFTGILDREIASRTAPNGNINAENLQGVKSGLGEQINNFSNSTDAYQKQLGQALKQASAEFRGLIQRANPQNAKELQAIDNGYAHFKRIQKAASAVGSNDGVFTPAQLLNAIRASDKTKDKRAFSEGAALMQKFASAGKDVLPSKVPDSGTAGRLLNNLFSLSGLTSTAGGIAAALPTAAIYSKTGTKAINAMINSNLLKALTTSRYAPMALAGATTPALTK